MKKKSTLLYALLMAICLTACTPETQPNQMSHIHQYGNWNTLKPATCSEKGIQERTCSCGEKKTVELSTTDHSFSNWKITKAATCTSTGTKEGICSVCGTKQTISIEKSNHSPDSNNVCTRCGEVCPINLTSSDETNANNVQYISERQTWYDDDEKCHVLAFSLLDSSEKAISAPAVVEIKIVNDNGEEVYSAVKVVKSSDYNTWSYNNGAVKKFQATIRIYDKEIQNGKVDTGDIYFTVYNTGYFSFDESKLSVDDLPVTPTTIILPKLPTTISDYNWDGSIDSSLKVTNITYEISGDDLYLYFTGEKTYDAEGSKYSQSCKVGWKLYDSEGYIIESGTFYSPGIAVGEKFKNEKEYVWDVIEPGETYKLVISSVD